MLKRLGLILEPVGLIVMNLEFNKIAPVMVRRLTGARRPS